MSGEILVQRGLDQGELVEEVTRIRAFVPAREALVIAQAVRGLLR